MAVIATVLVTVLLFMGMDSNSVYSFFNDPAVSLVFNLAVTTFCFGVPYLVAVKLGKFKLSGIIPLGKPKKGTALPYFFIGISFCALANILSSYMDSFFELFGIDYSTGGMEYPEGIWGFVLSVLVITIEPGLMEEFAFRGVVQGLLRRYGEGFAIMTSAILFGAMAAIGAWELLKGTGLVKHTRLCVYAMAMAFWCCLWSGLHIGYAWLLLGILIFWSILFAEVMRVPGLFQQIQDEYKVTIAGPTTLGAFLNSLQMGFRTFAIQKETSKVWELLGSVKTEFGKFGDVLAATKKKLEAVSTEIGKAETRSRVIEKKLKNVEALPIAETESNTQSFLEDLTEED
jgi:membrane protease YdiL (CAAX protease family)